LTDGNADWFSQSSTTYNGGDAAESGDIDDDQVSQMEILVEGEGTLTFWWKVDSEANYDFLQFLLDGQLVLDDNQKVPDIDGDVDWHQMQYTVTGAGTHSFLWQYAKEGDGNYAGEDCGWVDSVQWSGSVPEPASYGTVTYTYDPSGRRIEKDVDGDKTINI